MTSQAHYVADVTDAAVDRAACIIETRIRDLLLYGGLGDLPDVSVDIAIEIQQAWNLRFVSADPELNKELAALGY